MSFLADPVANAIFSALVGALLTVVFTWLTHLVQSWRGEFTGKWTQIIPPHAGEPEKIAIVTCRHRGDRIYAKTLRTLPTADFPQRWHVEGRIKRGLMFGIYWPETASRLPGSYGTLQFKIVNENLFAGFYVRARVSEAPDACMEFEETLNTIPIRWERIVQKKPKKTTS